MSMIMSQFKKPDKSLVSSTRNVTDCILRHCLALEGHEGAEPAPRAPLVNNVRACHVDRASTETLRRSLCCRLLLLMM